MPDLPLVAELLPAPDVEAALVRFGARPYCIFFDSALRHERLGRYSFLAADPWEVVRLAPGEPGGLEPLQQMLAQFPSDTLADLPPFQGGAAGLFSYELSRCFERIPPFARDEFRVPALCLGFYDTVLAFDHRQDRAWIVAHGFPESGNEKRRRRAQDRIEAFKAWLDEPEPAARARLETAKPLPAAQLAPQFRFSRSSELTSNFSPDGYLDTVQRVIDYIYAGDVFQVNLAQRLLHPARDDSLTLYRRLRHCNPAPFASYFDLGDFQICSASPERFLQVRKRRVEARPIKGTRSRTRQPEADLFRGDDLKASEKDRAENVMIVDLLRNDLSRVCTPESVRVSQLCGLEYYAYVQHLVSVIEGELAAGRDAVDLLAATFPGGSITGAPKVRAMEIIAELEPTSRGAYCGSLGYVGFDGAMDASILIRTMTAGRGWWQIPVGGGIVAQSNPQQELEETWHKAEGMIRALG